MSARFGRLAERARARAEAHAAAAARRLAADAAAAAPAGVAVEAVAGGVRLSARGLKRRFALEPGLRWLIGRVR
jgi:hypothetical protein